MWIKIISGISWRSFWRMDRAFSSVGHLKNVSCWFGRKSFFLSRNLPFESHKKAAVFDFTVLGGCDWSEVFVVLTLGGRSASEAGTFPLWFVDMVFSWVGNEALSMSGSFRVSLAADDWRGEKRFSVGILTSSKVSSSVNDFSRVSPWTLSKVVESREIPWAFRSARGLLPQHTDLPFEACCSCNCEFFAKSLACVFWRDRFSSCSFLITVVCCEKISWNDVKWEDSSVETSV